MRGISKFTVLACVLYVFSCCGPALAQGPAAKAPGPRAEQLKAFEATLRAFLTKGVLPIIDVEHHWGDKLPLAELIAKMDRNGVALTWLGQNEKHGSARALERHAQYPGRIVPTTIHGDGKRWHGKDLSLLAELAADVRSGRYFAMGEFEARHYVSGTNDRDVHLPVDSESFAAVFALSEETGLPFLLHHEAEDALLPELERMLQKHPRALVIWCHVGRNRNPRTWKAFPPPEGVRAFILKYPNLYFDLNQAKPGGTHPGTGQVDSNLYDVTQDMAGQKTGTLRKAWRELLEEFPERFLVGTDTNTGRWDQYDRVIQTLRTLVLSRLKPEAAARIAYKNAWRLMSGEEWKD